MTTTPQSPDSDWPEAWMMSNECNDRKAPNKKEPNVPVDASAMRKLGVCYWKMDVDNYTYPTKAMPWDSKEAVDERLVHLRDDRGYSYADIITVNPEHLPEYDNTVNDFFKEHIHQAEEIRYILGGSGYFDVRDSNDEWVRVCVKKGDLLALPGGIYHRFTTDPNDHIHTMRLFGGTPVWTAFNRPCDEHLSRKSYVHNYLEGTANGEVHIVDPFAGL